MCIRNFFPTHFSPPEQGLCWLGWSVRTSDLSSACLEVESNVDLLGVKGTPSPFSSCQLDML